MLVQNQRLTFELSGPEPGLSSTMRPKCCCVSIAFLCVPGTTQELVEPHVHFRIRACPSAHVRQKEILHKAPQTGGLASPFGLPEVARQRRRCAGRDKGWSRSSIFRTALTMHQKYRQEIVFLVSI